jgi:hypothetical protein
MMNNYGFLKDFFQFLIGFFLLPLSLFSWEITSQEAEQIGKQIFFNECSGKEEKLVWWNDGENFASLGIAHFIWYPKGERGPFEETFPTFLAFLSEQGISLPVWLKTTDACPWNSKGEFLEKHQEAKKKQLQTLLSRTLSLQATYIVKRFEQTLPMLFKDLTDEKTQPLLKKIESIAQSPQGKYALIDYLNFKGSGTSPHERYKGQGWGLRQVLEEMPDHPNPVIAFSETAKMILKRRIENAPPERHEERWLPGWLIRVDSYKKH